MSSTTPRANSVESCRILLDSRQFKCENYKITLRRRDFMNQRDFKKILAGFSITALVTGVTLAGVGYPEPAQAA